MLAGSLPQARLLHPPMSCPLAQKLGRDARAAARAAERVRGTTEAARPGAKGASAWTCPAPQKHPVSQGASGECQDRLALPRTQAARSRPAAHTCTMPTIIHHTQEYTCAMRRIY